MKIKNSLKVNALLAVATILVLGSCPGGIVASQFVSGFAGNAILIGGTFALFIVGILVWGNYFEMVASVEKKMEKEASREGDSQ